MGVFKVSPQFLLQTIMYALFMKRFNSSGFRFAVLANFRGIWKIKSFGNFHFSGRDYSYRFFLFRGLFYVRHARETRLFFHMLCKVEYLEIFGKHFRPDCSLFNVFCLYCNAKCWLSTPLPFWERFTCFAEYVTISPAKLP